MIYALVFFILGSIALAARQGHPYALTLAGAVSMVGVSVFGSAFTNYGFGFTSNIGNVFFAGSVFALTLLSLGWGVNYARQYVKDVFFVLFAWSVASAFIVDSGMRLLPSEIAEALHTIIAGADHILLASFVAFLVGQNVFVYVFDRYASLRRWARVLLATICMQIVDSVIFFPVAFYATLSVSDMVQVATVGLVVKVSIAVASLAFVPFALRGGVKYLV